MVLCDLETYLSLLVILGIVVWDSQFGPSQRPELPREHVSLFSDIRHVTQAVSVPLYCFRTERRAMPEVKR